MPRSRAKDGTDDSASALSDTVALGVVPDWQASVMIRRRYAGKVRADYALGDVERYYEHRHRCDEQQQSRHTPTYSYESDGHHTQPQ
jgi:hypothetical protein